MLFGSDILKLTQHEKTERVIEVKKQTKILIELREKSAEIMTIFQSCTF